MTMIGVRARQVLNLLAVLFITALYLALGYRLDPPGDDPIRAERPAPVPVTSVSIPAPIGSLHLRCAICTTRDCWPRIVTTIGTGSFTAILTDSDCVVVSMSVAAHGSVLLKDDLRVCAWQCNTKPDKRQLRIW